MDPRSSRGYLIGLFILPWRNAVDAASRSITITKLLPGLTTHLIRFTFNAVTNLNISIADIRMIFWLGVLLVRSAITCTWSLLRRGVRFLRRHDRACFALSVLCARVTDALWRQYIRHPPAAHVFRQGVLILPT
jgi:hypothetical protein